MPYKFRWWQLYSSQIANWGVHYFDLIRWLTGELAPSSVTAHGGRFAVDDDRTIPDTSETIFEHASKMLTLFSVYEANGQPVLNRGAEIELRGTLGTLYATAKGFEIVPERGGAFQDPKPRRKGEVVEGDRRRPRPASRARLPRLASRAVNGPTPTSRKATARRPSPTWRTSHSATRERLDWDPQTERFTNCAEANDLLHYTYRKPWSLV